MLLRPVGALLSLTLVRAMHLLHAGEGLFGERTRMAAAFTAASLVCSPSVHEGRQGKRPPQRQMPCHAMQHASSSDRARKS